MAFEDIKNADLEKSEGEVDSQNNGEPVIKRKDEKSSKPRLKSSKRSFKKLAGRP